MVNQFLLLLPLSVGFSFRAFVWFAVLCFRPSFAFNSQGTRFTFVVFSMPCRCYHSLTFPCSVFSM